MGRRHRLVAANEDVFHLVVVHDRGILTTRVCPVTRGQKKGGGRRVIQERGVVREGERARWNWGIEFDLT